MQGGDPTGTGTGGESIWGKAFEDEFATVRHFLKDIFELCFTDKIFRACLMIPEEFFQWRIRARIRIGNEIIRLKKCKIDEVNRVIQNVCYLFLE